MSGEPTLEAIALFRRLCDLPPGEQEAELDEACSGDRALRDAVQSLLEHDRLDTVPDARGVSAVPARIGSYRILGTLGAGGMGTVFEAEQDNPKRVVALKVLSLGLTSPEALRRFEYEALVLGRLHHPGVARIYEAGTADTGLGLQPYFAMERVEGIPITAHARENDVSIEDRIRLMIAVCDAVHHAHQKGVIHRDLKPANILVGADGKPVVLDFGIARTADVHATSPALTRPGQVIGTLAYMSPEQASGEPEAQDVRSDVYSLGIILFELLAGCLPYDIDHRSLEDALRAIREETPARLGTIRRSCRGDLETITARALEKAGERRYQSAADLGADLTRFLAHEPIVARPPSAVYQLRKFARRHKTTVALAAAVLMVALVGFVVSLTLYLRERDARQVAQEERDRAVRAEAAADARRSEAERERRVAHAINEFLNELFEEANPRNNPEGRQITMIEVLDLAAGRLDRAFRDEPEVEAALRLTIGVSYRELNAFDESRKNLDRARELSIAVFGESSPQALACLRHIGHLDLTMGGADQAAAIFRKALALAESSVGADAPLTALLHLDLGQALVGAAALDEAEDHVRSALPILEKTPESELDAAAAIGTLGEIRRRLSDHEGAAVLLRRHLEMLERFERDDGAQYVGALAMLGGLLWQQTEFVEAKEVFGRAASAARRIFGPEHQEVALALNNLAVLHRALGEHAEAVPLVEEALRVATDLHGPRNTLVATFKNNLAMALDAGGQDARAEELFREALVFQEEALGPSHPDLATYRRNLGGVLADLGRHEEARASYGRALDILTSHFGREHGRVATCLHDFARVQIALGRLDDAEAGLREAIGIHRRIHDDNTRNLNLGGSLERLASVAYARKDFEGASALLTEALAIARRAQGREHVHARELMTGLAGVLKEAGRYDEAARLAEEAYALDERLAGDAHPSTRKTVQTLVEIYEGWEKPEECAAWRARLD